MYEIGPYNLKRCPGVLADASEHGSQRSLSTDLKDVQALAVKISNDWPQRSLGSLSFGHWPSGSWMTL
jgi:hypothetical protein